jgi:hypothetical protein
LCFPFLGGASTLRTRGVTRSVSDGWRSLKNRRQLRQHLVDYRVRNAFQPRRLVMRSNRPLLLVRHRRRASPGAACSCEIFSEASGGCLRSFSHCRFVANNHERQAQSQRSRRRERCARFNFSRPAGSFICTRSSSPRACGRSPPSGRLGFRTEGVGWLALGCPRWRVCGAAPGIAGRSPTRSTAFFENVVRPPRGP